MSSGTAEPAPGGPTEEAPPRPITDEELQLLARYTGQHDLAALRRHVVALWSRACSGGAPVYLCIRALMFLEPRIGSHPDYQRALQLMQEARAAAAAAAAAAPPLWVDVGAAVGTDVRQLRLDGVQAGELVALDVPDAEHYWNIGLELYQDADAPPCAALFGDIIDDAVLPPPYAAPGAPPAAAAATAGSGLSPVRRQAQQAQRWASIAELAGAAHVVSCTAVLHCLGLEQVAALLSKMALLLRPGGLLLGSTLGAPEPRAWEASYQAGHQRWLHSAASLAAALRAAGFTDVAVAPTKWRDLDKSGSSIRPLVQRHVGGRLGEGERHMLAFTAVRPAA